MMALKSIFLIAFMFATIISIRAEPLFPACEVQDKICLGHAAETFILKTYQGNLSMNVKPIDPMVIPSFDVTVDGLDLAFHFKNTTITGLKSLKIHDFKMDFVEKSVTLKMKVDLTLVSAVEIELTKLQKAFSGDYSASFTVLEISQYSSNLKEIDGKQYFELGPERNSCEIIGEPVVTLGADLQNTISTDNDAVEMKPAWEPRKSAIRKEALCASANRAFETVIHNLRMMALAYPKEAFFTNV